MSTLDTAPLQTEPAPPGAGILVTGGAGYIGSHVVLALTAAGWPVVVLDNLSTGRRDLLPAGVPLIVGDVGDAGLVQDILADGSIGTVIHLAAAINVSESIQTPLRYYDENVIKSQTLIDACQAAGIDRFVFASSAAVYGDPPGGPITETVPLRPATPYGRTKVMTEHLLTDLGRVSPLRHVSLRFFNVAGADAAGRTGQSSGEENLIKAACAHAAGKRPLVAIYGTDYPTPDGTCIRDFIHVSDLADITVAAISHLVAGGDSLTVNCGSGRGWSVRQVIDRVASLSGQDLHIELRQRRAGDSVEVIADCHRLSNLLGQGRPMRDLDLMISSALTWERRT